MKAAAQVVEAFYPAGAVMVASRVVESWLTRSRPPGKAATGGTRLGRSHQDWAAAARRPGSSGELIHTAVRRTIVVASTRS